MSSQPACIPGGRHVNGTAGKGWEMPPESAANAKILVFIGMLELTKTALVTGINGQDGAYLAQLLLSKGYRVLGGMRRSSTPNVQRLEELGIAKDVAFVDLDLFELTNLMRCIESRKPDEIYNLAAQSFVALSFEQPLYTAEIDALGTLRFLEAIRHINPKIRFYQASTSEMFGKVQAIPQDETTPFYPRSPYGVAKLFGHWSTVNYRESYGLHASSGILFNHESPLRGREFVTRKITLGMAMISHGKAEVLELGNLDAKRDWGFAGDYVEGMWRMVQQETPGDYVLATGETHTVRSFAEKVAKWFGFELAWSGSAEREIGTDRKSGKVIIRVNPDFYRPAEVDLLLGSPRLAEEKLGWKRKVGFEDLTDMMCASDDRRVRNGRIEF
jgi:GDPmannose 4,6-dehydratase